MNGRTYHDFRITLEDGKRKKFTANTAREARERADAYLESIQAGAVNVSQGAKLTINAYLDQYLEERVLPYCKPNTYAGYAQKFDYYVRPVLGTTRVGDLKEVDIERWIQGLEGKLARYSVRQTFVALKTALNVAVDQYKLIPHNPAMNKNLMKKLNQRTAQVGEPERQINPYSTTETRKFVDGLRDWNGSGNSHPQAALFFTAIFCGLRLGELLALRWSDVDLDQGTITVRHNLSRITNERLVQEYGQIHVGTPKTTSSAAIVRMPVPVIEELKIHRDRQDATDFSSQWDQKMGDKKRYGARKTQHTTTNKVRAGNRELWGDLVFSSEVWTPLGANNLRRSLRVIQDTLQLRRIKFHDLRHTCASMLIEAGSSLVVVQKILRHANYQLTADTYIHLTDKMADETNRVFDHF